MESWVRVFVNGQQCIMADNIPDCFLKSSFPASDKFFVNHPDIDVLVQKINNGAYGVKTYNFNVRNTCNVVVEISNSTPGYLFNMGPTIEGLLDVVGKGNFENSAHIYYPLQIIEFKAIPNSYNYVYELMLIEFDKCKVDFALEHFIDSSKRNNSLFNWADRFGGK